MTVLIIEDEARILSFLARGLEAEGLTVECAEDGLLGLERARRGGYDLLILDLALPGMNGLEILHELQKESFGAPVLILSARSDLPTKLRGFELGASDYLAKPFSLDELIARVRAQLRRGNGTNGNHEHVLEAGPLTLDLTRRQARLGDRVTDLSDREFRLLQQLAEHPGEVLSRERLLANVWGYHFDSRSNVVEVCIRRLRSKLGPQAPIQTVRHAGYRLATAPPARTGWVDR
jgi:DNA-binding response OmpR family regulator